MKSLASILLIFSIIAANLVTSFESTLLAAEDFDENEVLKWIEWAKTAWSYYEPGVGVDFNTGILRASYRWPFLTDWDLGGYIVSIIKAELMGILPNKGEWGAEDRIEKVLRFLETRPISPYGIPYHLYSSTDGKPQGKDTTNVSDAGRLMIALHLLKKYRPDLAERINNIIKRNGYEILANDTSAWRTTAGFYKYYIAHGFKFFGFDNAYPVQQGLKEFEKIKNGRHVNVFGIELPVTEVTSEPMLHMVFELDVDEDYMKYLEGVYKVQEARYRVTRKFTAWSEGNTGLRGVTYVYQWIVTPRGETWKITPKEITPITFTKVAFGFHALYNTDYTRSLVEYAIKKDEERKNSLPYILFLPAKGFIEGVDESGRIVGDLVDKTQTIIISAAYYALKKTALETGEIILEPLPQKFIIGEKITINATYSDKSNLKKTCKWTVSIKDAKGVSYLEGEYGPTCNFNVEWTPEKPGSYIVEMRTFADYVLFNNTLTRTFNITISKTVNMEKDIRIVKVVYPDRVAVNEEFNISVSIEYDVREEETLLTLVLEDPLRNFLVKSNPIKIVGNGSSEFILRLQAPGDECLMHLKLYVSYTIGEDWVNDPKVIEVAINVLRNVIGTVIQRVKEIMYVTKTITATQTITLTKVNTTTVTLNFLKEVGNIKIVFIIIISMMLMTLAISVMLQKSKKVSRQRRCNL